MALTESQRKALEARKTQGGTKPAAAPAMPTVEAYEALGQATITANHILPEAPLPQIFNSIEEALRENAPAQVTEEEEIAEMPANSTPWDDVPAASVQQAPTGYKIPFGATTLGDTYVVPITKDDPRGLSPQQREANINRAVDSIAEFYKSGGVDLNRQLQQYEAPQAPAALPIVRGMNLEDPNIPQAQKEMMVESVYTYIGVEPTDFDKYVNQWTELLGCVVQPIEAEIPIIDELTGERRFQLTQWETPLFKINRENTDTGNKVIISGGGRQGHQFAVMMNGLFGIGDFKQAVWLWVTKEKRVGTNRQNFSQEPHSMYRFQFARSKPKSVK